MDVSRMKYARPLLQYFSQAMPENIPLSLAYLSTKSFLLRYLVWRIVFFPASFYFFFRLFNKLIVNNYTNVEKHCILTSKQMFNKEFVDNWIWTADLWYRKATALPTKPQPLRLKDC